MEVLVDTSIWSLALRRKKLKEGESLLLDLFRELINESRVKIIGPIRQEVLSGISDEAHYDKLKKNLSAFEDLPIECENYERAAEMFNQCKKKGVAGSHIDFLICAIAEMHHLSIFTTDQDFIFYSRHLPIRLFKTPE